jgi:hypothetical protein
MASGDATRRAAPHPRIVIFGQCRGLRFEDRMLIGESLISDGVDLTQQHYGSATWINRVPRCAI